jgi:uncharacterized protein
MSLPSASKPNRLLQERSPYLQQHAYNPVDWYPWGTEAIERARNEDKPILVSIGYSTCHWCHVMERESYEDAAVAAFMNRYLINIKIDREERPDVDKIYMTAVSAMTGSGGWPLNVFLTPDLKPFFGGTYFPPVSRWGQPAWLEVVKHIGESWANPDERKKMLEISGQVAAALTRYAESKGGAETVGEIEFEPCFRELRDQFDSERGGFGSAPKFPMPVYHNFLLRYWVRTRDADSLTMTLRTLEEMGKGGIYDHLGGGFSRYSTDRDWHIPHFEKMLYDNAQLAVNYLEAFQISSTPAYGRTARETLDYVLRDMTHPDGGFYSAEDADSLPISSATEKVEGAFYVWERKEILAALEDPMAKAFCLVYGVRDNGNARQDPHGEFRGKNILYRAHGSAEAARELHQSVEDLDRVLDEARKRLLEIRDQRPRPHRDEKILSGWNGLMITALARGFQALGDARYLSAAQKAAEFLRREFWKEGRLARSWRDGVVSAAGIADDYAFLAQGLLDLYEADFDARWLAWAEKLMLEMIREFGDSVRGGFYMTRADQDPNLLLRIREDQDNVEPAASSIAALNLARLAQYFDRSEYQKEAERTINGFSATLRQSPRALPQMLVALDFWRSEPLQIVITGHPDALETQSLLDAVRKRFLPVKIVIRNDASDRVELLRERLPFLNGMKPINGKPTAYVCIRHACKEPTTDRATLERLLDGSPERTPSASSPT